MNICSPFFTSDIMEISLHYTAILSRFASTILLLTRDKNIQFNSYHITARDTLSWLLANACRLIFAAVPLG